HGRERRHLLNKVLLCIVAERAQGGSAERALNGLRIQAKGGKLSADLLPHGFLRNTKVFTLPAVGQVAAKAVGGQEREPAPWRTIAMDPKNSERRAAFLVSGQRAAAASPAVQKRPEAGCHICVEVLGDLVGSGLEIGRFQLIAQVN